MAMLSWSIFLPGSFSGAVGLPLQLVIQKHPTETKGGAWFLFILSENAHQRLNGNIYLCCKKSDPRRDVLYYQVIIKILI